MKGEKLFVLDGKNQQILALSTDGKQMEVVLENIDGTPDGIAVDAANGHIYYTNMGTHYDANDGSICRVDFDGKNHVPIIAPGETFTPKQIKLDLLNRQMYWCDREGMRVMRAGLDGRDLTTLITTGTSEEERMDERNHCVGIEIDASTNTMWWTQKGPPKSGKGRIFTAKMNAPENESSFKRSDIRLLWKDLPECIDLDLDRTTDTLYWTDRGAAPNGNTLNRGTLFPVGEVQVLTQNLREAIGLSLDLEKQRVFYTDLGGSVYCQMLNSSVRCVLREDPQRSFTGIVYCP